MNHRINRLALGALASAAASLAFAAPGMAAGAQSVTFPFDFTFSNTCTGEPIDLHGEEHVVVHGDFDQPGGTQHVVVHQNLQNVSGVGEFTGTHYRYIDTGKSTQQSTEGAAGVFVGEAQLKEVAQGNVINGMIKTVLHTTINANGEITSSFENFHVNCNGGTGDPFFNEGDQIRF
jgi:hypothetical protein